MFIGNSFIPIHTSTSGCTCSGSSGYIGTLGVIGIILLIIGLCAGLIYLVHNLTEWKEDRGKYRGLIYALCFVVILSGVLMIIFDPEAKEAQKEEQQTYTLYVEEKDELNIICEKFDIIDIEGNLVTVREK